MTRRGRLKSRKNGRGAFKALRCFVHSKFALSFKFVNVVRLSHWGNKTRNFSRRGQHLRKHALSRSTQECEFIDESPINCTTRRCSQRISEKRCVRNALLFTGFIYTLFLWHIHPHSCFSFQKKTKKFLCCLRRWHMFADVSFERREKRLSS